MELVSHPLLVVLALQNSLLVLSDNVAALHQLLELFVHRLLVSVEYLRDSLHWVLTPHLLLVLQLSLELNYPGLFLKFQNWISLKVHYLNRTINVLQIKLNLSTGNRFYMILCFFFSISTNQMVTHFYLFYNSFHFMNLLSRIFLLLKSQDNIFHLLSKTCQNILYTSSSILQKYELNLHK